MPRYAWVGPVVPWLKGNTDGSSRNPQPPNSESKKPDKILGKNRSSSCAAVFRGNTKDVVKAIVEKHDPATDDRDMELQGLAIGISEGQDSVLESNGLYRMLHVETDCLPVVDHALGTSTLEAQTRLRNKHMTYASKLEAAVIGAREALSEGQLEAVLIGNIYNQRNKAADTLADFAHTKDDLKVGDRIVVRSGGNFDVFGKEFKEAVDKDKRGVSYYRSGDYTNAEDAKPILP